MRVGDYYATLRVSEECYNEIRDEMIKAGYDPQRFPLYLWGAGQNINEQLIDLNRFALGKSKEEDWILSRTRPEYDLRCDECGSPHWFDTSLPIDLWNRIAKPEDILCLLCIDDRMRAQGFTCEIEFYFVGKAVKSKLYGRGSIRSRWETLRRIFLRLKDGPR